MAASLFPVEIVERILQSDHLSTADVKAARRLSRNWAAAGASVLFHQISISCLLQDRDSFFHIARNPSLAKHVRVLKWQELPGAQRLQDALQDVGIQSPFWVTSFMALKRERPETAASLIAEFAAAVENLTGLHTIITESMGRSRLNTADPSIDLVVLHRQPMKEDAWSANPGFFTFLVPAMELLALPPNKSQIRSLKMVHEGVYSSIIFFRPSMTSIFSSLTHVDLLFPQCDRPSATTGLRTCLYQASGLVDLRLRCPKWRYSSFDFILNHTHVWPRLRHLHLRCSHIGDEECFLTFMTNHAQSLRTLHLDMNFGTGFLRRLSRVAEQSPFHLEEFQTSPDEQRDGNAIEGI
ncbi:hypothetical protein F4780DRAFT_687049 [Xylariomycetidae sp. FL0641]|nr:hypothetical protein F4780DRAFT_687049 [Xylariomycetidae sp. FL0641]